MRSTKQPLQKNIRSAIAQKGVTCVKIVAKTLLQTVRNVPSAQQFGARAHLHLRCQLSLQARVLQALLQARLRRIHRQVEHTQHAAEVPVTKVNVTFATHVANLGYQKGSNVCVVILKPVHSSVMRSTGTQNKTATCALHVAVILSSQRNVVLVHQNTALRIIT